MPNDLALAILFNFLGWDPTMSNLTRHVRIAFMLVGGGPGEGRAPSPWAVEDYDTSCHWQAYAYQSFYYFIISTTVLRREGRSTHL